MPRAGRRYEIYLPVHYNDGTPVEVEKFDQVERELVVRFGGVTSVQRQFPLKGAWRGERQTYLELVIVLSVIDLSGEAAAKKGRRTHSSGGARSAFDIGPVDLSPAGIPA